ncbi:PAS domain-containing protein [Caldimonas tepidiphila]|uniref:PAS domain-containing protein n=1 Tax=Caldimonas tepidiphila TaxID=2315841 RepID=UPI0014732C14|nr:PAS domain-containing protein [Caldimonas tepidiphila]
MQQTETRDSGIDLQFDAAFAALPVGVAHVSCDGRLLRVNARFCELSGREQGELLGLSAERVVPRDDLFLLSRQSLRLLSGERARCAMEMRLVRPGGRAVATRLSLSLHRNAAGRPEHFVAVVDESGGHGHDEAALLRRQEGRLRRALQAARMEVFEYEPASGQVSRQGYLTRLLGLPADAPSSEFLERVHPQDRQALISAMEALRPEQPAYSLEFRVCLPEGGELWLLDQARGQFDERGRLVRVVGVCTDITSRKEGELRRARERELLQRTLDSIPMMLSLYDPKGGTFTLNRHFETVLGWNSAEANEGDFLARLYPDPVERGEVLAFGRSCEPGWREWSATAKDGTRIPCEWTRVHLSEDMRLGIGWDLRQRRASEERLARLAERQALLLELSSSMLQTNQDEASLARAVFERIAAHLDADICFNYRADTPAGVLHLVAGFGIPAGLRETMRPRKFGEALCGAVAATSRPLSVGAAHVAQHEDAAFLRSIGGRAYMGQPLLGRNGRLLGTFALASTRREAFTPDEAEFFQTVCHFVSLAWKRLHFERELSRREEQHRMALDVGQLGSWRRELLDSDIYHLDERAQTLYALDRADVPVAALLERVHPEDRPRVEHYIAGAKHQRIGSEGQRIEYRVLDPGGRVRWLAVQTRLVIEQRDGASVLVRHGLIADITERKATEQSLQDTMSDLRRAQAVARVGSWRFDVRRRLRHWSDETYRILGMRPGRPLNHRGFLARVHPEDRERVDARWRAAAAGGEPYDLEHRVVVGSQVKWLRQKAELEFDARGELVSGFATVQDITEQKRAEAALRESEARLRALADAMPQLVWQADAAGNIDYCNSRRELLGGLSQDESGRCRWSDALHPEDRERSRDRWAQAVRAQQPYETEHRLLQADGDYRWHLSRAVPVPGADGRVDRWYGTSTDIHALKQADAAVQAFLATLGHELRNPLGPLRNAAQLLRFQGLGEAHLAWSAQVVDRQVRHLARLIDDLLDLSRVTQNKLELRRQRVTLRELVDGAVEGSVALIERHRHRLELALPEAEIVLDADPVRLVQVLQNLLDNAAKYTPPGGRIRLSADVDAAGLAISVQDDGIGIAPAGSERLFEMFYQADRGDEGGRSGLGIGLTLVRRLVQMHGGSVEVHSEGEGRGSTFVVRLPLPGAGPAAGAEVPPAAAGAALPRLRLLVVDDNVDAAESTALLLTLAGHEVHVAHDGAQAVREAERLRPDLVLLDIGMPVLDGCGAALRIRASDWGRSMPLVAQTGWAQEEDLRRTREAGFDAHLVKPVALEALTALIAELLGPRPAA